MTGQDYEIQDLVELCGVARRNIYFYVQQGLLPPPQGAGLAARYGSEHLTRLRLIPLLRRQGLRLDQIRERFLALSPVEMERLHEQLKESAQALTPKLPASTAQQGGSGQACIRYDLPGGIILVVPVDLRPEFRELAARLIRAGGAASTLVDNIRTG